MRSYVSKDRKRLICEFEAADAEQVRTSYRNAGVNFERCWSADMYGARRKAKGERMKVAAFVILLAFTGWAR